MDASHQGAALALHFPHPGQDVIQRCDGCIASHAEGAARAGATRQQAAEAIGVAMLMNGGPATIYGPRAYAAFCEFAQSQDPTSASAPEPAPASV